MNLRGLTVAALMVVAGQAYALPIGDHSITRELPGYMTLDRSSPYYKGFINGLGGKYGNEVRTPSQIFAEDYLAANGRIRTEKIDEIIQKVIKEEKTAFNVFCYGEIKKKDVTRPEDCRASTRPAKAADKWKRKPTQQAYAFVVQSLEHARTLAKSLPAITSDAILNSEPVQNFVEKLFEGLIVWDGLRYTDYQRANKDLYIVNGTADVAKKIEIEAKPEATNLIRQKGVAPSQFDPIPSGLWKPPTVPVGSADLGNYSKLTENLVGSEVVDPDAVLSVEYSSDAGGGSTPKFEVQYKGRKFKLKFGVPVPRPSDYGDLSKMVKAFVYDKLENQSEPIANNLAAALGFTIDPTYYKKFVRVYFPADDFDPKTIGTPEGKAKHASNFENQRARLVDTLSKKRTSSGTSLWMYDIASGLSKKHVKSDAQGRLYMELSQTTLEMKNHLDVGFNVGIFSKDGFGRQFKREFRALMLFLAWIGDKDTKNANADLQLIAVKNPDGSIGYKVGYSSSDLGNTLGDFVQKIRPNMFGYDLVSSVDRDKKTGKTKKITLNHRTMFWSPQFEAISLEDAKWLVGRLSQFSKSQLERAFTAVEVPEVVAKLYTQKLLRRIDQLIDALDMEGTVVREDVTGRELVVRKKSEIKDPKTFSINLPGVEFKNGQLVKAPPEVDDRWLESLKAYPEGSRQREALEGAIDMGIGAAALKIGQAMQRIGFGKEVFFEGVQVGVNSFLPARYLVENPSQDKTKPFWIVDVYRLGFAIGAGRSPHSEFGIEFDHKETVAMAGATRVYEFMRIRAVKDPSWNIKELLSIYKPQEALAAPLKDIKMKMIEGMAEGDAFISSSYLTFGGEARAKIPVYGPFGVYLGGGIYDTLIKRLHLFKEKDGSLLAEWAKMSDIHTRGELGLFVAFLRYHVLKKKFEVHKESDYLYRFDLSKPGQSEILSRNLTRDIPDNLEGIEAIGRRHLDRKSAETVANLFGLFRGIRNTGVETVEMEDPSRGIKERHILARNQIDLITNPFMQLAKKTRELHSEALLTPDGNVSAMVEMKYTKSGAKARHFFDAAKYFLPANYEDFLQVKPDELPNFIGNFIMEGELYFSPQAIRDILSANLSQARACALYLNAAEVGHLAMTWCHRLMDNFDPREIFALERQEEREGLLGARVFWQHYREAKESEQGPIETHLKKVARLLDSGPRPRVALIVLIGLTKPELIHRDTLFTSNLDFLPGLVADVGLPNNQVGGMGRKGIIDMRAGLPDLITGQLKRGLDTLFYDHDYRRGYQGRFMNLNFEREEEE